ncbi:MAG: 30S ribosomal protein S16 [Planctomycetia bacterium]|nr:30S ribosomal protein S16 [Planctomycetia bacterium]
MKRMGRKNRAYYRICATDKRSPRDGREIEVLGTYDPSVPDTDARCTLDGQRLQYWLSVGAQPSPTVRVLIKKYGPTGTRVKEMETARAPVAEVPVAETAEAPVSEASAETVAEATEQAAGPAGDSEPTAG